MIKYYYEICITYKFYNFQLLKYYIKIFDIKLKNIFVLKKNKLIY